MERDPYTEIDFPSRWFLEITSENKELIKNWLADTLKYDPINFDKYPFISDNGDMVEEGSLWTKSEAKISTYQFRKYVLNEDIDEPVEIEDLTLLTQLLNNLT